MSELKENFFDTVFKEFRNLTLEEKKGMEFNSCIKIDTRNTKLYMAKVLLNLSKERYYNYAVTYDVVIRAFDYLYEDNKGTIYPEYSTKYEEIYPDDELSIPNVAKKLATTYKEIFKNDHQMEKIYSYCTCTDRNKGKGVEHAFWLTCDVNGQIDIIDGSVEIDKKQQREHSYVQFRIDDFADKVSAEISNKKPRQIGVKLRVDGSCPSMSTFLALIDASGLNIKAELAKEGLPKFRTRKSKKTGLSEPFDPDIIALVSLTPHIIDKETRNDRNKIPKGIKLLPRSRRSELSDCYIIGTNKPNDSVPMEFGKSKRKSRIRSRRKSVRRKSIKRKSVKRKSRIRSRRKSRIRSIRKSKRKSVRRKSR